MLKNILSKELQYTILKSSLLVKKLEVPYHSQFLEVDDNYWNIRSCGGACIKMCLDYYNSKKIFDKNKKEELDNLKIIDIMNEVKNSGGYDIKNGFIHDFAVDYFKKYKLSSYRKEGLENILEITESINRENPVMVSIIKNTLEQTKYHLILVVGYEYILEENENENKIEYINSQNRIIKNIIYHEPESTSIESGSFRKCSLETFENSWRSKAIFVSGK